MYFKLISLDSRTRLLRIRRNTSQLFIVPIKAKKHIHIYFQFHLASPYYYIFDEYFRSSFFSWTWDEQWQVLGLHCAFSGSSPCGGLVEPNFSRYLKGRTSKTLWYCVRDYRTEKWNEILQQIYLWPMPCKTLRNYFVFLMWPCTKTHLKILGLQLPMG